MEIKCWKCGRDLPNVEAITEYGCLWCDPEYANKYKSLKI